MIPKLENYKTIQDWKWALYEIGKWYCTTCKEIMNRDEFNTRHKETDEPSAQCPPCHLKHSLKTRANKRMRETGAKYLKCWKHGRAFQKRIRNKKTGLYAVLAIFEGLLPDKTIRNWRNAALPSITLIPVATITKPKIGDKRRVWLHDLERIQHIFSDIHFNHKIVCSQSMDMSETGIAESKLDRYPDEINDYVTKTGDMSPLRGWCFDRGYMIVTDDDPTHLPEIVVECPIPTVGVHFYKMGAAGFYEFCAMILFWQMANDFDLCSVSQTGKLSNSTNERFHIDPETGKKKKKVTYNQLHRIESPLNLNAYPHGILFNVNAKWISYVGVFEDTAEVSIRLIKAGKKEGRKFITAIFQKVVLNFRSRDKSEGERNKDREDVGLNPKQQQLQDIGERQGAAPYAKDCIKAPFALII